VKRWQDAVWLGVRVTLLYAALTAPQTVAGPQSLVVLGFISLFKLVVVTAMTMTLFLIRKHFYIVLSCLVACISTYVYAVTSKEASLFPCLYAVYLLYFLLIVFLSEKNWN